MDRDRDPQLMKEECHNMMRGSEMRTEGDGVAVVV